MQGKLTSTLQENILTLAAHDNEHGKIVINLVDPSLFEGDYRLIYERIVDFWRIHKQAPALHTPDLVADFIDDPSNRKGNTFRRILQAMLDLSESINTEYVLSKLKIFIRGQKMKAAILESAEKLSSDEEQNIEAVEEIWNNLLRAREVGFDVGTRLTDFQKLLDYLARRSAEFQTGINVLDKNDIIPAKGEVFLWIAEAGHGKSWGLVHIGKIALMQRKKIVHITLEMPEEQVLQRYYQSIFSVSKKKAIAEITELQKDSNNKLIDFNTDKISPDFTFESDGVAKELENRVTQFQKKFQNLIIKRFPTRSLTIPALRAYLDMLETTEGFIPDMLILDYIGITKTDAKNHRISLGRNFEDFRGLCGERNVAGITAHQSSKESTKSSSVKSSHIAEDWSMVGTADAIITYSQTKMEHRFGLARLFVAKYRSESDKFTVLITQSYDVGQFALDSVILDSKYFDSLKQFSRENGEEFEEDNQADDE